MMTEIMIITSNAEKKYWTPIIKNEDLFVFNSQLGICIVLEV